MKAWLRERPSHALGGGSGCGLVALVVMLVVVGSASAHPFAFEDTSFCAPDKVVRDFGLSKLPPVREVPKSAKEFGYGAVAMHEVSSQVMSDPVPFGYWFRRERNYKNSAVPLNWTVTARLWTINSRGRTFREVGHKRLFIDRLNAVDRPFIEVAPPKNRRGFYRFDMQIRSQADRVLGSYSTYLKVVRPSWQPRLRLDQERLQPGQKLLIRLENHGGEPIAFENRFSVQRFENGRWTRVPVLTRWTWPKRTRFLGPGGASKCTSISLPNDAPIGLYRISKSVVKADGFSDGEVFRLTAPFEVVDSLGGIEYQ